MTKEELKLRLKIYREMGRVIFNFMIKPTLYMICMWGFQTVAAFLFFRDWWTAAGFISAITLYQITSAEFNKEFFQSRTGAIE